MVSGRARPAQRKHYLDRFFKAFMFLGFGLRFVLGPGGIRELPEGPRRALGGLPGGSGAPGARAKKPSTFKRLDVRRRTVWLGSKARAAPVRARRLGPPVVGHGGRRCFGS